jgi:superfamily II DNA or RNA helicase
MNVRKINSDSSFDNDSDDDYSEEISSDEEENIKKPLTLTKKIENIQALPIKSTSTTDSSSSKVPSISSSSSPPRISPNILNKPSQNYNLTNSKKSSSSSRELSSSVPSDSTVSSEEEIIPEMKSSSSSVPSGTTISSEGEITSEIKSSSSSVPSGTTVSSEGEIIPEMKSSSLSVPSESTVSSEGEITSEIKSSSSSVPSESTVSREEEIIPKMKSSSSSVPSDSAVSSEEEIIPKMKSSSSSVPSDSTVSSEEESIKKIVDVINRDEIKNETCKRSDSKKCSINKKKIEIEKQNNEELGEMPDNVDNFLYPSLDDPNFSIKISKKKEFNDTRYDAIIADVKRYSDKLSNIEYGLLPQQAFVRNFLSFQTPYNSLLLFHGLGSGKTCSAIGVCEEMREYLIQMGINKKIIIVASPNVQDNFKLQLFDERKLKQVDGIWTTSGCVSNNLLKEVNVSNTKEMTKELIVNSVKKLINTYYEFYGYTQFSNEIDKYIENKENVLKDNEVIKILQNTFSDRLIVIDEVHNIRIDKETSNKNITKNLMLLVSIVNGIRLLLLSATPMFNNYTEIIWLINMMNVNDKRGIIHISDVFNKNGTFKKDKSGNEIGKELLMRKAIGYISYVRGENPYTFPFRVYPNVFSEDNTFLNTEMYPKYQLNGKKIAEETKIKKINLYLTQIGEYQELGYRYVIDNLRNKKEQQKKGFKDTKAFGYSDLQMPIQALNIVYPYDELKNLVRKIKNIDYTEDIENVDDLENIETLKNTIVGGAIDSDEENSFESSDEIPPTENNSSDKEISFESSDKIPSTENNSSNEEYSIEGELEVEPETVKQSVLKNPVIYKIDPKEIIGIQGLKRVMKYQDTVKPLFKGNFTYKRGYGRIFHSSEIGKYSSKIQAICESIYNTNNNIVSDGIIIIYSNYIDGGLVPMALALEEMGFTRFNENSLFENPPTTPVDVRTMKAPTNKSNFKPAKYTMITGDPKLSKNNDNDMKYITADENINGENIKVVLISQAGSEGLDFKGIRQIHIMEPWYNINRLEQIIGRGVRNGSHKLLPFEERNVMIFLHGTILGFNPDEESADLYIYRSTELKAVKIGKITRLLKESSVDCLLNYDQSLLTNKNLNTIEANQNITQQLSTKQIINNFQVGDIDNSVTCDFMTCEYKCNPSPKDKIEEDDISFDTYNETFIKSNTDKITNRIKQLMKERFFYEQENFIKRINFPKKYPLPQIYSGITQIINDPSEIILDKYGRTGHLINLGNYYLFQPSEIDYPNISIYERSVPVNFKHDNINFKIKNKLVKPVIDKRNIFGEIEEQYEFEESKENDYREQIKKSKMTSKLQILKKYYNIYKNWVDDSIKSSDIKSKEESIHNFIFKYMTRDNTIIKLNDKNERKILLSELMVHKLFDVLNLQEKINIMNALEIDLPDRDLENELYVFFINSLKEYLNSKIINERGIIGVMFSIGKNKTTDLNYYVKNRNNIWEEAQPQDKKIINNSQLYKISNIKSFNLDEYLGFIGIQKNKKDSYIFKLKKNKTLEGKNKVSKGFVCESTKKQELLDNVISKFNVNLDGTPKINNINKRQYQPTDLCILTELTYRYYQMIRYQNKLWFVSTEFATINNFEEKEK